MNINPLHNQQSEEAVLGAIFLDCLEDGNNKILSRISLAPEDFYHEIHQRIFKTMLELDRAGKTIDTIMVSERIQQYSEVSRIAAEAFTAANIKQHVNIVKSLSDQRKLQRLCATILQKLNNGIYENIDDPAGEINRTLKDILTGQASDIVSMKDIAQVTFEVIEKRMCDKGPISGVPSGFKALDLITDGFQPGDLILIAGRPGKGKSALAQAICQNAALAGYPCGYISLEMGKQQLGIRTLASVSKIEMNRLRKGLVSSDMFRTIIKATGRMSELPVYFSFSAGRISEIQRAISQMVEMHSAKMIVVDYLQLARNPETRNREREIGEISTLLKHTARIHEIPVLCLAQLNREPEKRENGRPVLADLRDSGQQEQDADIVIFLYSHKDPDLINVEIAKGRNIGTSLLTLSWDKERMIFRDVDE